LVGGRIRGSRRRRGAAVLHPRRVGSASRAAQTGHHRPVWSGQWQVCVLTAHRCTVGAPHPAHMVARTARPAKPHAGEQKGSVNGRGSERRREARPVGGVGTRRQRGEGPTEPIWQWDVRRATAALAPPPSPPRATHGARSPRVSVVAAGGSPTGRRTEALLGNSRTEGPLLGPFVREQTPNRRTPFCSAPLLVCFVCRLLHSQELARVTALIMMIGVFLKPKPISGFKESMWPSPSWTAVRGSATSSLGNVKYDSASPVLMCSSLVPFADGFPAGQPLPSANCREHPSFHELPRSTASPLASTPYLTLFTCSIGAWHLGALLNRLWCV